MSFLKSKALLLAYLFISSEAFHIASSIKSSPGVRTTSVKNGFYHRSHLQMVNQNNFRKGVATLATGLMLGSGLGLDVAPVAADGPPAQLTQTVRNEPKEIRYSAFIDMVENSEIEKVSFSSDGQRLVAIDTDGNRLKMDALPNDPELLTILTKNKVDVTVMPATNQSGGMLDGILPSLIFPAVLLLGLLFFSRRNPDDADTNGGMGNGIGGGMGNPMEFGRSQSKIQLQPDTNTKFADVAGCDQAKFELEEIVDFLKNPKKYTDVGAVIPRGVMLEGPPGTGKTLLARAVAGEAGVPFIAISGSEFVEMFVGVGASRVRDLFGTAKKNAPCIIFIDEIDAVGRQRGSGVAGGNDEREQTLNQILTEMDGFDGNGGIIVIAATNRIDILDNALLRPGRFDRKVNVDLPNFEGRVAILKVHARGKPLAGDIDLENIARRTPGYSGAQLQNLMNEAAIFAGRKEKSIIEWVDIDSALDRIMVGLEKKGGWGEAQHMKEIVAYHEAGHAVVGALMPDYDMVQKVTIIPRSNGAGGLTYFAPNEARLESGLYSRQYLEAQLAVALGGRLAEEIIYGEDGVTTGASNDLQQVANIAKRMVAQWGMSEKVGQIVVSSDDGGSMDQSQQWGPNMIELVDEEVQRIVNNAYVLCKEILTKNRDLLEKLASRLLEVESVTAEELGMMIMEQGSNLWVPPYGIYDLDNDPEDKLPFKEQPSPASMLGQPA